MRLSALGRLGVLVAVAAWTLFSFVLFLVLAVVVSVIAALYLFGPDRSNR